MPAAIQDVKISYKIFLVFFVAKYVRARKVLVSRSVEGMISM